MEFGTKMLQRMWHCRCARFTLPYEHFCFYVNMLRAILHNFSMYQHWTCSSKMQVNGIVLVPKLILLLSSMFMKHSSCMLVGNFKGCICVLGSAPVYVIVKSNQIEAIVGVNEEALFDLHRQNCILVIQVFFVVNFHWSFSLSCIEELIGYVKL